jgi:hypothetical protein
MLVFSKVREMLLDTLNMKLDIEEIKTRLDNQDKNLELVFTYLDGSLKNRLTHFHIIGLDIKECLKNKFGYYICV